MLHHPMWKIGNQTQKEIQLVPQSHCKVNVASFIKYGSICFTQKWYAEKLARY